MAVDAISAPMLVGGALQWLSSGLVAGVLGLLCGALVTPTSGGCVALFYINVLAIRHSTADGLDGGLEGLHYVQCRLLEGSLLFLLAVIAYDVCFNLQPARQSDAAQTAPKPQPPQLRVGRRARQLDVTEDEQQWLHKERWRCLEENVVLDILSRLQPNDIAALRCVCLHWYSSCKSTVCSLKPVQLPVKDLVVDFPALRTLDLSSCTKDITPSKLRHLRHLRHLLELNLGCHHRLIASTVTDRCLNELVTLSQLRTLNLSQCVHVGDAGLMSLLYLTNLSALNISGCVAVTDVGIVLATQLSGLTRLEMPWCLNVTDHGLRSIANLTKLVHLNISGCQLVTQAGLIALSALTNLERLSLLNLGYSKVCVTDAALERLTGLVKLRSLGLGGMQLCNTEVTDASMALLAGCFTGLTQLALMSLDITDVGVGHIAALRDLQALNLRGCTRVTSASMCQLTRLSRLTDLCLLHNAKLPVDDTCLQAVAHLTGLSVLGLGKFTPNGTGANETALASLSLLNRLSVLSFALYPGRFGELGCGALAALTALQHLDLQGSVHVDESVLRAVGGLTQLRSLHVSRCVGVGDAALGRITRLSQLHTLNICGCARVGDAGFAAVAQLPSLTQLTAQQCVGVTDAGVAALSSLSRLAVLDISCCERVSGVGFERFAAAGGRSLASLALNSCSSLNDAGLRAVGRLATLTKLDMSNCPLISDAGVNYLRNLRLLTGLDVAQCPRLGDAALSVAAAAMPSLATLKLSGCVRVTDRGVAQLEALSSLLTVQLDRCVHLTNDALASLARITGITSLRLSRCPNITDAGVAALVSLSRLSTLSLAHCPQLTDMGVIALAPLTTLASLEF